MASRVRNSEEKIVINNKNDHDHDYDDGMEVCVETNKRVLEECGAENVTPSKVHKRKKVRPDQVEDISNADILEAIYSLCKIFDKQKKKLEELSKKMEENCNAISEVKEEMKAHKQKEAVLELELSDLKKENKELRSRVGELDRYKRRWNLRIKGSSEKQNENIRQEVITLLAKIAPGVGCPGKWKRPLSTRFIVLAEKKEIGRVRSSCSFQNESTETKS